MRMILAASMTAMVFGGLSAPVLAQDTAEAKAPDFKQDAAWHNQQQLALAERGYADGWRYLEGGLLWRRVKGDGVGPRPTVADTVTVHYAGTFTDGTTFDSSFDRGDPATFPLGRLIPAWQLAIPQMAVGDTIEIAAPSSIAYGPVGNARIPGGATLLFTIELFAIGGR